MSEFTQGNNFKYQKKLQLNGVDYATLTAADEVKCKLQSYETGGDTLEMSQNLNPSQVTLDDPSTGYVSWQLKAADTDGLTVGLYKLIFQVEDGDDKHEWVDPTPVKITTQYIT
jgi:hypothetical protein